MKKVSPRTRSELNALRVDAPKNEQQKKSRRNAEEREQQVRQVFLTNSKAFLEVLPAKASRHATKGKCSSVKSLREVLSEKVTDTKGLEKNISPRTRSELDMINALNCDAVNVEQYQKDYHLLGLLHLLLHPVSFRASVDIVLKRGFYDVVKSPPN